MKTISNISALASIIGFLIIYFSKTNLSSISIIEYLCLGVFILASIIIIIVEIRRRPKIYKSATEINNYMYNWVNNIGRIVIFSRDMSWAVDDRIKESLLKKARNNELIICIPQINLLASELKNAGAIIIEYSYIEHVPQSRFTIVRYGRSDSKVAIGKTFNDKGHIIEEFGNGNHPLFHIATDLVEILIKTNEKRHQL